MLTTHHPVDFRYTRAEREAIFRHAREHDVEKGGRYDARAACILLRQEVTTILMPFSQEPGLICKVRKWALWFRDA